MIVAVATSTPRLSSKARRRTARLVKPEEKLWTPPDFAQRRRQDFEDGIMPFSYVDFIER
jgi:hypothetical protein